MKTIENNKLIAEFMNERKPNLELDETKSGYHYHDSWDWLMSVIKKINILVSDSVLITNYFQNGTYIHHYTDDLYVTSNIEKVYEELIEFIKCYNIVLR